MTEQPQTSVRRLALRQKVAMMVNRYYVNELDEQGAEGGLLAFAEQKRMKLREEVVFFADESRAQPVFGFKARKRLDVASGYDVMTADGDAIGSFQKQFGASLLRSTWTLRTADGQESVGAERSQSVAIIRRVWDFFPVVGDLGSPWLFHFDFVRPDGSLVMSSVKKAGIRDRYVVDLPPDGAGASLDWRLGAAMAVALDAMQSR